MSSYPGGDELVAAYEDQVEALERVFRARSVVRADPRSRFFELSGPDFEARLREDRAELDRWVLMMLVASFEATLRSDAEERIKAKTKDAARKPLKALYEPNPDRVRLEDMMKVWEEVAAVGATEKGNVRRLLKHRHWLAHGRHWINKHGRLPDPLDAHSELGDYADAVRKAVSDFPRA